MTKDHLSHTQRQVIENGLGNLKSFTEIASGIGKSRTTVMREVRLHLIESRKAGCGRIGNSCQHRKNCKKYFLCNDKCSKKCSTCPQCNDNCKDYLEEKCPKLDVAPYACNGCKEENRCVLRKKYYLHDAADKQYKETLHSSREGVAMTPEQMQSLGAALQPGLALGQSVHHIMATSPDSFNVCEKSVYRYINGGLLEKAHGYDLVKAVSMKPRRKKTVEHKVDAKCRKGRDLQDFNKYVEANQDIRAVQMDTVPIGGKALLTMQFVSCELMLAFVRDRNTSDTVIDWFNFMEDKLGLAAFRRIFPVILTDNGSEFSNPDALETSPSNGERRTRIFYCDPYSSWQKGCVENNNGNLRRIFEKGKSFRNVDQNRVSLAMSHLNSMVRKSIGDKSPIEVFQALYGDNILNKLGITLIPPTEVNLTPRLLD